MRMDRHDHGHKDEWLMDAMCGHDDDVPESKHSHTDDDDDPVSHRVYVEYLEKMSQWYRRA